MELKLKKEELTNIMKSFCLVTGIRIVLFDVDGIEFFAYPEKGNSFCLEMQKNCLFASACEKSNSQSFNKAKTTGEIQLYHCHAGLVEASLPLIINEQLIGYAMFGQISDIKDKNTLEKIIREKIKDYKMDLSPSFKKIKYFSEEKIIASYDLLNACISFILSNQLITYKKDSLLHEIDNFIKINLDTQISSYEICKNFGISRTSLYNLFKSAYGMGVSEYIMTFRINHAKELLLNSSLKVNEISTLCGFNDYNYFTKVFKNKTSYSPRAYRKKN